MIVHWHKAGIGKKAAREGVIIPAQSIAARHIKHATGGGETSADHADAIHTHGRAATVYAERSTNQRRSACGDFGTRQ